MQRNIRNSLLSQLPLLAQPAHREAATTTSAAAAPEPAAAEESTTDAGAKAEDDEEVAEAGSGKKKGGKGKGKGEGKGKGGGSKGKGGKSKKGQDEDEADDGGGGAGAEDLGEATVLDDIWPKKEPLGLTKWCVTATLRGFSKAAPHREAKSRPAVTREYPSTRSRASRCSSTTLTDRSSLP